MIKRTYPSNFKDLIKPIKKELVIIVLLSILGTLALLIAPIAITLGVHQYRIGEYSRFFIWILLASMGIVLKQLLHVFSIGYAHIVEAKFRYRLRKDFSDKLSRLPLGFFNTLSSGGIRKMISEDTIKIHTIVAHSISDATAGFTLPVACVIVMLFFEWRTALFILGALAITLMIGMFWMGISMKNMEDINTKYEMAQREMSHEVVEMVDGIKEIKNFGIGGNLFQRFDQALHRFSTISFAWLDKGSKPMTFIMAMIQPTMMLFLSLGICIFSMKKAWLLPEYTILFMLLSIALPSSMMQVFQLSNFIRDGKHSIDNLLALYKENDQVYKEDTKAFELGDIEFKGVSFSYDGKNKVLKNINCKMKKGTCTALVGVSGSGKTSMAHLIARFWDVSEGEVSIHGVNIKDFSEQDLLKNIALVFQDISLMHASIGENIALAKPNASREEIIAVAKSAFIHDRIMRLPKGYDSIYGEDNVVLSGGEKQRLTIARAFLLDAPIILLDEATAQADAESEVEIQKALSALSKEKTVIMIAHRLTSIVGADQILVLEDGKIVQEGIHEDLIKKEGLYKEMWTSQNEGEGEA